MPVIDVHTHMLSPEWVEGIRDHGGPRYQVREIRPGVSAVFLGGNILVPMLPRMFDGEERLRLMDEGGIDVSILSLPPPGNDFGDAAIATGVAKISNDTLARFTEAHPDRFRWLASLPWEHADSAIGELDRACADGAIGLIVPANINDRYLTDDAFAPIWTAVDERALPVLIHPTAPPGSFGQIYSHHLLTLVGFLYDTTLAVSHMIFEGFFDTYPNLKLIVPHAGATLPLVVTRLDSGFRSAFGGQPRISRPPSDYLKNLWYDDIAANAEGLTLCLKMGDPARVVHGSDYPFIEFGRAVARLDPLDAATRKAILEDNAGRLFAI